MGNVGSVRVDHGKSTGLKTAGGNHLVDVVARTELLSTDKEEVGPYRTRMNQRQEEGIVVVGPEHRRRREMAEELRQNGIIVSRLWRFDELISAIDSVFGLVVPMCRFRRLDQKYMWMRNLWLVVARRGSHQETKENTILANVALLKVVTAKLVEKDEDARPAKLVIVNPRARVRSFVGNDRGPFLVVVYAETVDFDLVGADIVSGHTSIRLDQGPAVAVIFSWQRFQREIGGPIDDIGVIVLLAFGGTRKK